MCVIWKSWGIPKPGCCFKPGCLQFLRRGALLRSFVPLLIFFCMLSGHPEELQSLPSRAYPSGPDPSEPLPPDLIRPRFWPDCDPIRTRNPPFQVRIWSESGQNRVQIRCTHLRLLVSLHLTAFGTPALGNFRKKRAGHPWHKKNTWKIVVSGVCSDIQQLEVQSVSSYHPPNKLLTLWATGGQPVNSQTFLCFSTSSFIVLFDGFLDCILIYEDPVLTPIPNPWIPY